VNTKRIFGATISMICLGWSCASTAAPQGKVEGAHFGYTLEKCHQEMDVVRRVLAKYPTVELGEWTWVLVRSKDWKRILGGRGLNPNSPAFTYLLKRETFIEEALVSNVSSRSVELSGLWHMPVDKLLDFAVRHELGHAVCNERDELEANRAAESLLLRKPISCYRRLAATRLVAPAKTRP
jgi:hypothetical protein